MKYEDLKFVVPIESCSYEEDSNFVVSKIKGILDERMASGGNKIVIKTNLKKGLPLENINKIAGPIIEAWACEVFEEIQYDPNNVFSLTSVEAQDRLGMADIVLQFKKDSGALTGNVDVKATSINIKNSGKSPNITSFSRIRSAYVSDPDFMFIILSIKHKLFSSNDASTGLVDSVIEVEAYDAYDLKFLGESNFSYNPALGTGQIQIVDIRNVSYHYRTTWQMCQLLDQKFLKSSRRTLNDFVTEAEKNGWLVNS